MQINFLAHLIVPMFCLTTLNSLHVTAMNDAIMCHLWIGKEMERNDLGLISDGCSEFTKKG
jgi:peroxiredoxin